MYVVLLALSFLAVAHGETACQICVNKTMRQMRADLDARKNLAKSNVESARLTCFTKFGCNPKFGKENPHAQMTPEKMNLTTAQKTEWECLKSAFQTTANTLKSCVKKSPSFPSQFVMPEILNEGELCHHFGVGEGPKGGDEHMKSPPQNEKSGNSGNSHGEGKENHDMVGEFCPNSTKDAQDAIRSCLEKLVPSGQKSADGNGQKRGDANGKKDGDSNGHNGGDSSGHKGGDSNGKKGGDSNGHKAGDSNGGSHGSGQHSSEEDELEGFQNIFFAATYECTKELHASDSKQNCTAEFLGVRNAICGCRNETEQVAMGAFKPCFPSNRSQSDAGRNDAMSHGAPANNGKKEGHENGKQDHDGHGNEKQDHDKHGRQGPHGSFFDELCGDFDGKKKPEQSARAAGATASRKTVTMRKNKTTTTNKASVAARVKTQVKP